MSKFDGINVLTSILVVLLIILVTSLSLTLEVHRVEASGTIYIRADGSIDPPTAPISSMDNVTYIFTDDVNETMKVERDNIVVDGAGHGSFVEYSLAGIDLSGRNNVTIMNMRIEGYYWSLAGISLASSSDCTISGTSITTKTLSPVLPPAIYLDNSSNNRMINNTFANNGLLLVSLSYQNDVENNTINDKPLVYLEDISNRTVDDAGQVILVRCNNIEVNSLDLHRTVAAVELIETNWTTVSGNNLTDNNVGIALKSSVNNTIFKNNVTENSVGLWVERSSYNIISESSIAQNNYGLFLRNSDQNSIYRNNVTKNGEGIHFDFSGGNCIRENNITENHDCGIGVAGFGAGGSNAIYHNNLVNNTNQDIVSFNSTDVWDDAYPSGGNFWSNYTGIDADADGIGDTPYNIDAHQADRYPLIAPITVLDAGTWNGTAYNVYVVSNSTASNFQLNTTQKIISFNVTGVEGTLGVCRITIPNIIIEDLWQGNYRVLLNGELWPFRNSTDPTNTHIYVNYTHSGHQIIIVPEFSLVVILPILMMVTLLAVIVYRRKTREFLN